MTSGLTLLLAGDVMTGRGVDQILPRPGDPQLWEPSVGDAREYVARAEIRNGPIPRPVPFSWPWGDVLRIVDRAGPSARLINLETSVTAGGSPVPDKQIHYRMNPANIPCLTAFHPDVCVVANNHVLDFGWAGLRDTLASLRAAGLRPAGAGADDTEAFRPVVIPVPGASRLVVTAAGLASSGIPASWAAAGSRPGVALLGDLSAATAARISERAGRVKRAGDVAVVSLHWGSNWGYEVPDGHIAFAHMLVDRGIDVVYGHSSHHPRPIEIYRGKLILYGCGDLVDDYEGIGGYESFRDDLRLIYLASLDPGTGRLAGLVMVPVQARRMRLQRASTIDAGWLRRLLQDVSRPFSTAFDTEGDGSIRLRAGAV